MFRGLLRTFTAAAARFRRRPQPTRTPEQDRYLESLTASLEAGAEEYLAWLADHHWPGDEYLDLERDWRAESGAAEPAADHAGAGRSACPGCLGPSKDVWPCRTCGRLLHHACGHGMRRRLVRRPYRTRDMDSESVIAEWVCTDCAAVVALDVDHWGADAED
ncbi:MAG: hypothetical protein JWO67_1733 [Streptosporangiaceae bacterium]|nr:hypothetical protein [Streptosporangiaceae bacterium]